MSRQDYELIARVLRDSRPPKDGTMVAIHRIDAWQAVVDGFASALGSTNTRFDRARFIAACVGEDATDSAGRTVRYSRA